MGERMSATPNDTATSRNLIILVVSLLFTKVAVAGIAAMAAY